MNYQPVHARWSVGPYEIEKLTEAVYALDTDEGESMYLVCGSEQAVLIDTGSSAMSVYPVIRDLYRGPVDVALTHAHFDHMYHCDAFRNVSLHEADLRAWRTLLGPVVALSSIGSGKKAKRYETGSYRPLREGDVLSLGGRELLVIHAPGHTPGSVLFVDVRDRLIFTGDAIGSGDYVWMWMPGCLCLTDYQDTLTHLQKALAPYAGFQMLGGHRKQGQPFNEDGFLLDMNVISDLQTLCGQVLAGESPVVRTERNFGFLTSLYRYGTAGLVLRDNKIR